LISAADLAAMRATQALALPSTCSISRRALSADGMGGYSETWATLTASVACRLSPHSAPTEVIMAERYGGRQTWQLTVPSGTDVTADDRVTIGSVTYEVVGINSAGAWETARRVIVGRVT
jgi:head-tail adaptor